MILKTIRKLHLWTGVIVAVFLLLQSITGLILANSHWSGQGPPRAGFDASLGLNESTQVGTPGWEGPGLQRGRAGSGGPYAGGRDLGTLAVIRALHEGRAGNYDFSLLLDVVAIGFILVTITGLILAYKVLKRPKEKARLKNGDARHEIPEAPAGDATTPDNGADAPGSNVNEDSPDRAKGE